MKKKLLLPNHKRIEEGNTHNNQQFINVGLGIFEQELSSVIGCRVMEVGKMLISACTADIIIELESV